MAERLHFTKAALERLPTPTVRTYFRDTTEPSLGVYVTPAGTKCYHAVVTVAGKTTRLALGKFPAVSVPLAREKARAAAVEVAKGGNPTETKREAKASAVTLQEVLDQYLAARDLKDSTRADYRRALKETFGAWLPRPLAALTEREVLRVYLERGKESKARTDNAARVLRAVANFAKATHKRPNGVSLFPSNPTDILGEARVRYDIQRRRTVITAADLPAWWQAVNALPVVERDYLTFLALTGTRSSEAAGLRWEDIHGGTFHLADPKNRRAVDLPLPDFVAASLKARAQPAGLVFPSETGLPLDPRGAVAKTVAASGVSFTPHDLRRTFASIANGLDLNHYTVKHLLNHTISKADVTGGYDVPDPDRLKAASARIERRILQLVGTATATVVELHRRAG